MSQCECIHTPIAAPPGADGVRCPNDSVGKVETAGHSWEMCAQCIKDLTGQEPLDIREPHIR